MPNCSLFVPFSFIRVQSEFASVFHSSTETLFSFSKFSILNLSFPPLSSVCPLSIFFYLRTSQPGCRYKSTQASSWLWKFLRLPPRIGESFNQVRHQAFWKLQLLCLRSTLICEYSLGEKESESCLQHS